MENDSITARLANLSPAKRALLELRLGERNAAAPAPSPIARRSAREPAPLSFAQQRLWFLNQLDPESPVYNESSAVRMSGVLDLEAFRQALNQIVSRHEVLRTTIAAVDGSPRQWVAQNREVELPLVDLRGMPEPERDSEAQRLIADAVRQPFDLSRDLVLRALMLRMAEREYIFLVVRHHIVSDGWSTGIFWRELSVLYQAFVLGAPCPLPELAIQYADYAAWQRNWLQGDVLERQLAYWKAQLAGLATLQLPTDRLRPAAQSFCGASQSLALPAELSQKLDALSRRERATLFMTLLAGFQTLLYRYAQQEDIAVGCPIAGRTRRELEPLVGFFVNTLVIRVDFSGDPTFRELLARVREVALDAYAHQDLPFERLVEELQPERNLSRSPLFQIAFSYQNTPQHSLEIPGVLVTPTEKKVETAKFDLHMSVNSDHGIRATLHYATDLYDDATITRLLSHFQSLLEGMVANPEGPVSELPLLSEAETVQLLAGCHDAGRNDCGYRCLHRRFEEQAENTPDAVALVFEKEQMTYLELNQRANRLAHYLRKAGVEAETLVGICMECSLEMVVGLLGILKAGAAYVPLDPQYPKDRLAFMLEDIQATVLLTQERLVERFPDANLRVVCLDRDWLEIAAESQANVLNEVTADSLAYVIYTSGTTGDPKGVMISHRNVDRLFHSTEPWFHFGKDDVWTVFHSYAFDFSVWEIWGALLYGGKAVIVPSWMRRSPEQFYELLGREQVTVLNQTPSSFRQIIQADETLGAQVQLALRWIIFGGEALDFQSLKPWFDRHGDQRPQLINMYGITESTVHVTYRVIKEADLTAGVTSLIGGPIPDLDLYVLDSHRNLVPIGVPGELYVGGAGLAIGYLNRRELTAERFVDHPFDSGQGRRLYRSGDLVRRRGDGDIEYLGRIDNQVKIRGYRIELGEIEATLARHPAVKESVILAREDTSGDPRLIAYVVGTENSSPSAQDLRRFLQHKLPDYMVPSVFVFMDSLPLTANGKLDRKALPEPDQTRPELDETFAAPTTPVEEILANIWAEVLKLDKVGIHDNFFDLGGHSLLATQVVSRIRDAFRVEFPLRTLFESATLAGLADSVQAGMGIENNLRRGQPIVAVLRSNASPLSFAQERLWFLDHLDPDSATYNVAAAFRLAGDLHVNALEQSLNEVVRRHEVLRTVFATANSKPVQRILPSLTLSLTPIDLSAQPDNQRELALQSGLKEEALQPFDLSQGPLIRACLWRLARHDHVLALNMHHIVSDGWSMGVLFREISALYRASRSGQSNPLPELAVQYADYAIWQRDWLQGENLDIQLSYWRKQLDGLSTLQLPTDHPRPAVQTYRGTSQSVDLSAQLSEALKGLSRREGVTLFMTLLAAFQVLLSRYCGQSDIAVGTPIAGRTRQEIEGLIGFFVNTLVLRTDLSNNPTFKDLLRQVRETTLEAYTHQDLPFEKLVEEIHPERNPSITPLFQVMLILQNNADIPLDLEHLTVNPIGTGSHIAKFDLSLALSERQGSLRASFNYNTDLFDGPTIERMLGHFKNLLEGIVADPDRRIGGLPLLTEAEKHQLLVEWNATETDYSKDKCIHELFEEQVKRTPDAVAAVFEEEQLTYRELNRRANQLAHYLIRQGVQAETTVGVYLDRSLELAVAVLAVLKSGGVYVPVDPSYPNERVKFILQDVQASLVVSTQSLASQLSLFGARIVTLDTELEKLELFDNSNPPIMIGSQSPVYVLYTSGSTGIPKGVVMSHRALNNLISWQINKFDQGLPARTLQFAPLGFDVSIQEMFSTWCSGGSLYLIRNELRQDGSNLSKYIEKQSIERIFLPFVALRQLAEVAVNDTFTFQSLREIVTAGEPLRLTKPLRQFIDRLENCRLHNQYGPTESHVVTEYTLKPRFQHEPDLPPIGRPIANTQIYILDDSLDPVPIGIVGEIYIGGDGVAQGYLNRPDLTQEKFIPNPFSDQPGAKLYKTGDLARHLPNGDIEYLGRLDNQVKIRGYRIELGEIESVLAQHPAIQQAVVLAREDAPGDRRLVAYTTATAGTNPSAHDLRSYLQQKIPEYMVPSVFVFMDSLPLTANGKLDRKALPEPDQTRPELDETFTAPTTPVEEILANIWAEVLKLDKVGIHDNFFHLGGHSLLATQVVSRIRDAFKVDLALRSLFEAPTIQGLAQKLHDLGNKLDAAKTVRIAPVARDQYRIQSTN